MSLHKRIDASIVLSEKDDEATIVIRTDDGTKLQYQDILDAVVEMVVLHYELVAMPAERGYDDGMH